MYNTFKPRALWVGLAPLLKSLHNMAGKIFGLFIWIHDDPIQGNVLNLSNITSPRKSFNEYAVGDLVMAKCPGFGIAEGILGKIAGKFIIKYFMPEANMNKC